MKTKEQVPDVLGLFQSLMAAKYQTKHGEFASSILWTTVGSLKYEATCETVRPSERRYAMRVLRSMEARIREIDAALAKAEGGAS